ncbi:DUF1801 domain-containing protein [Sphingobacteriales bacterium UPWRP_1]|nr:hypothetical protein BVG80_04075 [Sphingobacteriales bacterium TSM_CSM]PSJ75731.1 DUF1801 domain-containing protein [Sphingobacteriales bacterium UPWRP_1]
MSELKTKPNNQSVADFLNAVTDATQKQDCIAICTLMQEVTGHQPKMWGTAIVGFGSYHYKYASGQQGDWMLAGFSPRKQNLSIYLMSGFEPLQAQLQQLGKHKTGKGCLYIKKLSDVNMEVLKEMVAISVKVLKEQYP